MALVKQCLLKPTETMIQPEDVLTFLTNHATKCSISLNEIEYTFLTFLHKDGIDQSKMSFGQFVERMVRP